MVRVVSYLAVLLAAGCGPKVETFPPVAGKVTVKGETLRKGTVSFRPDATKGNGTSHHPTGEIDGEGNYVLFTTGKKGAPPGWYRVLVFADGNPNPAPGKPSQWLHHPKYTSEKTTDVWVEVVEKPPPGGYDLNLSR
jgi:hypothetical protein